jgi:hypothetical protein
MNKCGPDWLVGGVLVMFACLVGVIGLSLSP